MIKVSAAEFQRNIGKYQDAALTQPVVVARNGRERTVMISVEEYHRLKRRDLMVAADLLRVAVFCTLPFTTSAAEIVGLALVAGLATGFFRPAVYAGVPNLFTPEELPDANALPARSVKQPWREQCPARAYGARTGCSCPFDRSHAG